MQTRFVYWILILIVFVGFAQNAPAQTAKARIIQRLPIEKNEPVTVTDVKVNGQSIGFDRKFSADDDWMKSLVITVKNGSDKRISFLNVYLFLGHSGSDEPGPLFNLLSYGNWALQTRKPMPGEHSIGLAPGETTDLKLSPQKFIDLTRFLGDLKFSSPVDRVRFRFGSVIFDDDTLWSGEVFRRNPADPTNWINVNH